MKTVYFARHGQSEGNVAKEYQTLESPLSSVGKKQAGELAERASRIKFDVLISSPLARAEQTAEKIREKTAHEIEFSELFVERVKPTRLSGKPYGDPEAERLHDEWQESLYTPDMKAEDGENFNDLIKRADNALEFLLKHKAENIFVVSHGYFLRVLILRAMLSDSLNSEIFKAFQRNAEMENTGLSVLKYGDRFYGKGWYLWTYNDHAHLG